MRLDKFLCEMGCGTRSEVKKRIARGEALVNGSPVKNAAQHIDEGADQVIFSGKPVRYCKYEYFMLNKPGGVISASKADLRDKGAVCVVDLIRSDRNASLFPVGRLDKDTEGLLLITNDGQLAHRLLSPRRHVWKCYYAELSVPLAAEDLAALSFGVNIGDEKPTLPCRVRAVRGEAEARQILSGLCSAHEGEEEQNDTCQSVDRLSQSICEIRPSALGSGRGVCGTEEGPVEPAARILIAIQEGRYHQIKRMMEARNSSVTYLKRLSMGALVLDEALLPGESRPLSEEEKAALEIEQAGVGG